MAFFLIFSQKLVIAHLVLMVLEGKGPFFPTALAPDPGGSRPDPFRCGILVCRSPIRLNRLSISSRHIW